MGPQITGIRKDAQQLRQKVVETGGSLLVVRGDVRILDPDVREFTIGRDPNQMLVFDEPGVSRAHAALVNRSGRWVFEDRSVNGSWVYRDIPRRVRDGRFDLQHADAFRCGRESPWVLYENYSPLVTVRDTEDGDVVYLAELSKAERELLALFLDLEMSGADASYRTLAERLVKSEHTAKSQMKSIRRKWDCRDNRQIVAKARRSGLIPS